MFVRRLEALFSNSHAEFIARGNVFFTVTLFDRHPEIYWNKKKKYCWAERVALNKSGEKSFRVIKEQC